MCPLPFSISLSPFKSRKGPKGSPALGHHLSKARTFPEVSESGERDTEDSPPPPAQERDLLHPCPGDGTGQGKMQAGAPGSVG